MDSSSSNSRPQNLSLPPPQTSYPVPPVPAGQSHYRSLLQDHPSEPSSTLALPPIPPLHPFPTVSYHQLYHSWNVPFVPGLDPLSDPTQHQARLSQGQISHLPEWQPDQLVRNCPICYSTFTLFFRRHHCRKCGRVVCAQCSPNRLTLPSATVVRPPGEVPPTQGLDTLGLPSPAQWGCLLGGSMYSPPAIGTSNRHSWAGSVHTPGDQSAVGFADWRGHEGPAPGMEDVRVCCDCFSSTTFGRNEHPSASGSSTSIHGTWNGSSLPSTQGRPPAAELWTPPGIDTPDGNGRRRRQSLQGGRSLPYNYDPAYRQQSASYMPQNSASGSNYTLPPPVPSSQSRSQLANAYSITPQLQAKYASYFGARDRMFGFSGSSSQHGPPANMPATNVTQSNTNQSHASESPQPQHISQPHAQPRASTGRSRVKLKETDYCPICTLPLPPPHPETGDESEREAHVQDCIRSHETSSSPHGISNHPLAAMSQAETRSGLSSTATTMSVTEFLRQSGVAPKPSGRMVVYKAREEDTWDYSSEDGKEKTQIEVSLSSHAVIDLTRDDETPTETIARRQPTTNVKCRKRAECVICFEEFEIGELIARLECLCRYHKGCIREWFDRKGNGDCPVHAVRE